MMLERYSFVVLSHSLTHLDGPSFAIIDANSGEVLGAAVEYVRFPASLLRRFLNKRLFPASFEIREQPDDSLLTNVSRLGLIVQPRLEVRDALGSLVGSVAGSGSLRCKPLLVYDRYDQRFAEIDGRLRDRHFRFVDAREAVELGVVSQQIPRNDWLHRSFPGSTFQYHLQINRCLDDQPLAKMLILAVSLAAAYC